LDRLAGLPSSARRHDQAASEGWQVRRDSNPQPSVLETDALPIELLTFKSLMISDR
jgi:hypothetical protein